MKKGILKNEVIVVVGKYRFLRYSWGSVVHLKADSYCEKHQNYGHNLTISVRE